jgi:hypothetical protein
VKAMKFLYTLNRLKGVVSRENENDPQDGRLGQSHVGQPETPLNHHGLFELKHETRNVGLMPLPNLALCLFLSPNTHTHTHTHTHTDTFIKNHVLRSAAYQNENPFVTWTTLAERRNEVSLWCNSSYHILYRGGTQLH